MLILGAAKRTVAWKEAGITLDLVPLDEDVNNRLFEQTTQRVTNDAGQVVDVKRDTERYAQRVGQHCIQGWTGVGARDGSPVECTPEHIAQFMLIEPAQAFVFARVRGLELHLHQEVDAAKKD